MRVLITSKTRLYNARCVGGLREDNVSVRLLTPAKDNQPLTTPFSIGQIWDLQMVPRDDCTPPHVEDVLVTGQSFVKDQTNMAQHLLSRIVPWQGDPFVLFGGLVHSTGNNHLFIRKPGVPDRSTWFWISDADLTQTDENGKVYYRHGTTGISLSYVGEEAPLPSIPAGTLLRVSLARWWKPPNADATLEERCYLQLSGWY